MPRLGVRDPHGTGKTALKASLSSMCLARAVTYTRLANPSFSGTTSATRTWNDANGDFLPQESELGAVSARDWRAAHHAALRSAINSGFGTRGTAGKLGDD